MRLSVLPPLLFALIAGAGAAYAETGGAAPPAATAAPEGGPKQGTAVIRPPAGVDPGINKAKPDIGATVEPMPVIPPPGTAGGDPNVIAK